jgi:hypothetical protein
MSLGISRPPMRTSYTSGHSKLECYMHESQRHITTFTRLTYIVWPGRDSDLAIPVRGHGGQTRSNPQDVSLMSSTTAGFAEYHVFPVLSSSPLVLLNCLLRCSLMEYKLGDACIGMHTLTILWKPELDTLDNESILPSIMKYIRCLNSWEDIGSH